MKGIMEDIPDKKDTYYQRNRERVLARGKDNCRPHRWRYVADYAQSYQEHRDNIIEQHKAHNRQYYQQNREEVLERKREYYRRHRDEVSGRNRVWNQERQDYMNKLARERRGAYAFVDAVVSVNFNVSLSFG